MKSILFILALMILSPLRAVKIELKVNGLTNNRGLVQVAIWSGANGFPDDYRRAKFLRTVSLDNLDSIIFQDVDTGEYAIAVYHDENEDTVLNTSRFGIPKEGFGFSRNPRIRFGPPKFEKAKFSVQENQKVQTTVTINYP
jgi:uncharacterized protein (DUF2141 family)